MGNYCCEAPVGQDETVYVFSAKPVNITYDPLRIFKIVGVFEAGMRADATYGPSLFRVRNARVEEALGARMFKTEIFQRCLEALEWRWSVSVDIPCSLLVKTKPALPRRGKQVQASRIGLKEERPDARSWRFTRVPALTANLGRTSRIDSLTFIALDARAASGGGLSRLKRLSIARSFTGRSARTNFLCCLLIAATPLLGGFAPQPQAHIAAAILQ